MHKKSQSKIIFSSLIFLISIFSIFSFYGGDGSITNPYNISTCTELQNMSSDLSANYSLINSIDCNGFDYGDGFGFLPIGNFSNNFIGSLDGNNHTISNIFINRSSTQYIGLIGYFNSGKVDNLALVGVEIYGSNYVGGLVGRTGYLSGEVDNSFVTGSISGNEGVGGIIGYLGNKVSNSYFEGDISGDRYIGGVVGLNYALNAVINNTFSSGTVSANNLSGGLVGGLGGDLYSSFSTSDVSNSINNGGLIGNMGSGSVTNSWWLNDSSTVNNSIGDYSGGSVSINTSLVESYFYNCNNSPLNSWDNTSIWNCGGSGYPNLLSFTNTFENSVSSSSLFPFYSPLVLVLMGLYFMIS